MLLLKLCPRSVDSMRKFDACNENYLVLDCGGPVNKERLLPGHGTLIFSSCLKVYLELMRSSYSAFEIHCIATLNLNLVMGLQSSIS